MRALWSGDGEALAEIVLQGEEAEEAEKYWLHPALLDAALQVLVAAFGGDRAQLPFALSECVVRMRGAKRAWVYAQAEEGKAGAGRVKLLSDAGHVLAELSGVQFRRVEPGVFQRAGAGGVESVYRLEWRRTDAEAHFAPKQFGGTWAVLGGEVASSDSGRRLAEELSAKLEKAGAKCVRAGRVESPEGVVGEGAAGRGGVSIWRRSQRGRKPGGGGRGECGMGDGGGEGAGGARGEARAVVGDGRGAGGREAEKK